MKILSAVLAFVFLTNCGQQQAIGDQTRINQTPVNQTIASVSPTPAAKREQTSAAECKICDFDYAAYKGDLKKDEIEGLLLALNDEYHALAVYEQVNKDFGSPRPFVNIQKAEAQHADRLKQVFKDYNVPVPENKWLGSAPKFESVAEACKAGVEGEIANRDLYKKLFETTAREDILMVYRALQRASEENHLPAFERCGGGNGRGTGRGRNF